MKIDIQTNKAATNIFGLHNQPRKTTRYSKKNEARVVRWGGGGGGGFWKSQCDITCQHEQLNKF